MGNLPHFEKQIKSFIVPSKFLFYAHPALREICGEFELMGFPLGWDREKMDAQPHWYMNLYRVYWSCKHAHESAEMAKATRK